VCLIVADPEAGFQPDVADFVPETFQSSATSACNAGMTVLHTTSNESIMLKYMRLVCFSHSMPPGWHANAWYAADYTSFSHVNQQ
jgi:hypothetical protein